jgi:hypothetical protein
MMIELLAVQRADHQQIVGACRQVRQEVGEVHPALAVFGPCAWRTEQHRRVFLDEREPDFVEHLFRQRLAVQFVQLRLRIEQIQVRRRAGLEQKDAVLGLGCEVRRPDR